MGCAGLGGRNGLVEIVVATCDLNNVYHCNSRMHMADYVAQNSPPHMSFRVLASGSCWI